MPSLLPEQFQYLLDKFNLYYWHIISSLNAQFFMYNIKLIFQMHVGTFL